MFSPSVENARRELDFILGQTSSPKSKTILMREGVEDEPYYFQSNQQLWIIVLYLLQ